MIVKAEDLIKELSSSYSNPKCKIGRMVKEGKYTPIIRGLYETDPDTEGHLLASEIYGPSYLSFEYALGVHGLIMPRDRTYTSATCNKHRTKLFETPFGTYTYRDVPASVFGLEVDMIDDGEYTYSIANPEKALCDMLYTLPPVRNRAEMEHLLLDIVCVDKYKLPEMDLRTVTFLSERYHCTNVKLLRSYLASD
ncbi:MAG: hypothetical protein II855_00970 [Candidatus Methanomethylophilaceae archaeon]|nr:hypothetical protein [Candidatus Methanomethylophilaceae archaeon]